MKWTRLFEEAGGTDGSRVRAGGWEAKAESQMMQ